MASSSCFVGRVPFCCSTVAVLVLGLWSGPAFGKQADLSAIEVYPTAVSQAYVQITGFTLNSKDEVRLCGGNQTINKSSYGKLPRITLVPGMSLERGADGILLLSHGGQPECVVPGNLKLEKAEEETPSELADKAVLQGQIQSKSLISAVALPPLAKGVKIVLVATLDTELAEFLLAQRSSTIEAWKSYLARYANGQHTGEAKAALSILYVRDGQSVLAAYQASLKATEPNYEKLQAAKYALTEATAIAPANAATEAFDKQIIQQSNDLNAKGMVEIAAYREALANQVSGYNHLVSAEAISLVTLGLEPKLPGTVLLSQSCTQERATLDRRFVDFANKLSAKRPEEAYETIKPLRPFAKDYPRVQDCLNTLYAYHVDLGKKDAADGNPQAEVSEFQKAAEVESTPEIADLLQTAKKLAQESVDKAAVTAAVSESQTAEENKDYITAFEVLDRLSPSQRKLVSDRLDSLKDQYAQTASATAKDLQRTHTPIKGLADEIGYQRAYLLLDRCYELTSDPSLQDRITILGQSLSAYYLVQAKHYLERPDGTGANVGWQYLTEALGYKGADAGPVRDERQRALAAHQLRSKLSIKVVFRDQTSRKEAVNFVEQLTDSLATGLESSSFNIKVVRPTETPAVPPNFVLVGDVLQNAKSNSIERNAKASRYRSGEHEVVNEPWSAANREYENAKSTLSTDQAELSGAGNRGKKNQIADARKKADEDQRKVDAALVKLDALPKTRSEEIERPYTYTEQINHLKATVELQFKIQDMSGSAIVPEVSINEKQEKPFTVLENVKSDDTTGVRDVGEVPSEDAFLETVEYAARDRLLKEAKDKVAGLPALILRSADQKANERDNDGAAELYMLYLDSTESQTTIERKKAQRFLFDNYNFRAYGDPQSAGPVQGGQQIANSQ